MTKEDNIKTTNFTSQKLYNIDNYKKWRNDMQNSLGAQGLTKNSWKATPKTHPLLPTS